MFKNLGWPEILIILGGILLLFGGARLPQMGRDLGRSFRGFKDGLAGHADEAPAAKKSTAPPSNEGPQSTEH